MLPDEPAVRPRSNSDLPPFDQIRRAIACSLMPCPIRFTAFCEEIGGAEIAAFQRQPERAVALGDQRRHAGIDLRADAHAGRPPAPRPPRRRSRRRRPRCGARRHRRACARAQRRNARPWRRSPRGRNSAARRPPQRDRPSNRRSAQRRSAPAIQVAAMSTRHRAVHQFAPDRSPAPDAISDRPPPGAARPSSKSRRAPQPGPSPGLAPLDVPASLPGAAEIFRQAKRDAGAAGHQPVAGERCAQRHQVAVGHRIGDDQPHALAALRREGFGAAPPLQRARCRAGPARPRPWSAGAASGGCWDRSSASAGASPCPIPTSSLSPTKRWPMKSRRPVAGKTGQTTASSAPSRSSSASATGPILPSGVELKVEQYLNRNCSHPCALQPVAPLPAIAAPLRAAGDGARLQRDHAGLAIGRRAVLRHADELRRRHAALGERVGEVAGAGEIVGYGTEKHGIPAMPGARCRAHPRYARE